MYHLSRVFAVAHDKSCVCFPVHCTFLTAANPLICQRKVSIIWNLYFALEAAVLLAAPVTHGTDGNEDRGPSDLASKWGPIAQTHAEKQPTPESPLGSSEEKMYR